VHGVGAVDWGTGLAGSRPLRWVSSLRDWRWWGSLPRAYALGYHSAAAARLWFGGCRVPYVSQFSKLGIPRRSFLGFRGTGYPPATITSKNYI